MIVAIVIAAIVILGGIIVVATGKGGELYFDRPELPNRTDFNSSSDVAGYRPPGALIGYSPVATERALAHIARTIAERDAEIDWLRRRLAELQPESLPDEPAETSANGPTGSVADDNLPAAGARWQRGSTTAHNANGFGTPQPVSPRRGADE